MLERHLVTNYEYVYDIAGTKIIYGNPDVLNPSFIAAPVDFKKLRGGARLMWLM